MLTIPDTGEMENLEALFFSSRLLRNDIFDLPVMANLRVVRRQGD
jgi:hypothetical protein